MRKASKVIIWLIVIVTVFYLLLNIAIGLFGKAIIINEVEKNLKRKAALESLSIGFPFTVTIRNLDIGGLAKIDLFSLRPSILGFLAGKIILNELKVVKPQISLEMDEAGKLNIPPLFLSGSKQPPVLLAGLNIEDGRVIFTDRKIDAAGYKIVINNIDVRVSKVAFPPTSLFARFNLSASLGEDQNKPRGQAIASGWLDFRPKDMDGDVELKDIDVTYFIPYYRQYISEKKLASGKLNFTSHLKSENNNLKAKCHLEVADLAYEKEALAEGQSSSVDLVSGIVGLFSGPANKTSFDFTINTKFDNPRLSAKELKGIFGQAAAQNIINQPPENLFGNIKEAEKQFKELGKSLKELFKKKE